MVFKPVSRSFILLGLFALGLTLLGGILSVFFYIPAFYPTLQRLGLQMPQAHSLHTSFAMAWLFLTPVGIVYSMLENDPQGLNVAERKLANLQLALWIAAGAGIFASLLLKVYSGREYMEYSPFFSALILAGWLLFARIFFVRVYKGFWAAPVYIHMWAVGILLFIYAYAEGNSWSLGVLKNQPVADMQVQWKSLGTFFGAMNLSVYGCALYISERISGNKAYAQSGLAFSLFWVGLLSSFTNYSHHTYHMPQDETIKWIGFVSSMLELVILVKVLRDISGLIRKKIGGGSGGFSQPLLYLNSSTGWSLVNLILAIAISVPPVNTLVHGTHVIVAHSMGSMIGIDGFILFAAFAWFGGEKKADARFYRGAGLVVHSSLAVMFLALVFSGMAEGFYKYMGQPVPYSLSPAWQIFALSGVTLAAAMGVLLFFWIKEIYQSPSRA